jgi:hypothetical protein
VVLKTIGRPVGDRAKKQHIKRYRNAVANLDDIAREGRLESVLKPVLKSRDSTLVGDAYYLLVSNSGDSTTASSWLKRFEENMPGHPNVMAARQFLSRFSYHNMKKELTQTRPDQIPGEFVQISDDSTAMDWQLQAHELTSGEWARVMDESPPHDPNRPKTGITPERAEAFIQRLNTLADSWVYEIANLQVWKSAFGRPGYNWSPDPETLSDYAWHSGNACRKVQKVALKQQGPDGFYDLLGNANELCWEMTNGDSTRQPQWYLCGGSIAVDSLTISRIPVVQWDMADYDSSLVGFRLMRRLSVEQDSL